MTDILDIATVNALLLNAENFCSQARRAFGNTDAVTALDRITRATAALKRAQIEIKDRAAKGGK